MNNTAAISTDMGNEFKTECNAFLEQQNIVHKYKDPKQLNSLAVLDRAVMSIKKQMFQRMSRQNSTQWHLILKKIEDGYNETVINTLGGAPNDLEGDTESNKVLQFQHFQNNARAIEHNDSMLKAKAQKLQATNAFREMAPREQWQRAYKPRWTNEIHGVKEIKAGQVVDDKGKTQALASVQPVPADTARRETPDFRGRGLRDERLRQDLSRFAKTLYDRLGNRQLALTTAAREMPAGFAEAKPTTLLFSQFLALYPNLFVVSGVGPAKIVKRKRK